MSFPFSKKRSFLLDDLIKEATSPEPRSICHFGGGGDAPSGQTTTVQKSDPWAGQQGYLTDVFTKAQDLNNNFNPSYYPGSTVAPMDPLQQQAIDAEAQRGASGSPVMDASQSNLTSTLSGDNRYANPGMALLQGTAMGDPNATPGSNTLYNYANGDMLKAGNPYFSSMADDVLAKVVPGLETQFNQGNRMNSPGAAYAVSKGATDALGNLAGQMYSQEQQMQLGAANQLTNNSLGASTQIGGFFNDALNNELKANALAPGAAATDYQNIAAVGDAGAQKQNASQQQINDLIARYNYSQQIPYEKLAEYSNLVQGGYGGTSTLSQPYFSNQGANALGGALGGGYLGSMLGPSLGLSSGSGGAGGAGLGALLAFL